MVFFPSGSGVHFWHVFHVFCMPCFSLVSSFRSRGGGVLDVGDIVRAQEELSRLRRDRRLPVFHDELTLGPSVIFGLFINGGWPSRQGKQEEVPARP